MHESNEFASDGISTCIFFNVSWRKHPSSVRTRIFLSNIHVALLDGSLFYLWSVVVQTPTFIFCFLTAFYEESTTKSEKKSQQSKTQMEQKKSSTQKQVIEMHQHSQEMKEMSSSNYSSEVLEWQKMAKKEKVMSMSSTKKEQRMISVRRHLACLFLIY